MRLTAPLLPLPLLLVAPWGMPEVSKASASSAGLAGVHTACRVSLAPGGTGRESTACMAK